ncbi:MAG: Calx-beta domain-containing protein, partial [Pseudomonadota bacterium]
MILMILSLSFIENLQGQTVWDISANSGYNNNIAGIGRDDCGGLNQKQSKSVESDAIVSVGRGGISATNSGNSNTIDSDLSFFIWGNNDASAQTNWTLNNISVSGSECQFLMLNRIWKAEETNDVGVISFQVDVDNGNFDLPALPSGNDGSYYLFTDDDGDFTNGGTSSLQLSNTSGSLWAASFGEAADMYFSFGVRLTSPFEITIEDGSGLLSDTENEADLGGIDLYAVIPFSLSHAVSANYATANGTATTANSDYNSSSGTVTIGAGSASQVISNVIDVNDDNVGEADESYTISLSSPTNVCLGSDDTYTVNITNDDAPTLTINDVSVNEGAGTATLTVTASNTTVGNITFSYNANDNSAVDTEDYTDVSSTGAIIAGSTTTSIVVSITNDVLDEANEDFNVLISGASTTGGVTIADNTGVITIVDNDATPEICIDASTSVNEATANAVISISINAVSGQNVSVNYATSNGTANAGSDYTSTSGTATITAGNLSTNISIPIINDTDDELNQTFTVSLSSPTNATIGSGCSNTTTIVDNDDPPANCQNITVQLDATGNVSITEDAVDNNSNVNGTVVSYDTDVTAFDCTDVGANTVTLTVTDNNGDTNTCTATVTVEDNVDPVATCQNITVQLDATGNATITTGDINNGSSDACGIASLSLDDTAFDCTEVGANTVTLTVEDNNSNTSTCTATVTVEDNVDPVATCQNITVQLDATGNATITTGDINNGSSDACGIASLSLNETAFDCAEVGANTVTLTVEDNNSNTSTCTATVTVEDNVDPV